MIDQNQVRDRMQKMVDMLATDVATIRTGRATPALIENIEVEAYEGQKMALKGLGSISVTDARTLTFQPWDASVIKQIKNGIMASNTGFNPAIDGEIIRIVLPPMSSEQRDDYVKLLHRKLEGVKEMIRSVRADFRKDIMDAKQDKSISEDEAKRDEDELQKITDEFTEKLEKIAGDKEKEIRQV